METCSRRADGYEFQNVLIRPGSDINRQWLIEYIKCNRSLFQLS
uniref:Uncharacterized protein n=1 Tax=Parascaris equorum TaxID=6256 RepID=A0A914RA53_PAREQ